MSFGPTDQVSLLKTTFSDGEPNLEWKRCGFAGKALRELLNGLQPSPDMRNYEISIEIDEQFRGCLNEDWLRDVIVETLGIQEESATELDLLITNEDTVQHLNREYRGMDSPTDVLAFALAGGAPNSDADSFVEPPDGLAHLGEVILSYPRAVRQAEEYGHSVEQEVALLVIHGVLHLLGYDHDTPAGEAEMRSLEERILSEVLRQVEGVQLPWKGEVT